MLAKARYREASLQSFRDVLCAWLATLLPAPPRPPAYRPPAGSVRRRGRAGHDANQGSRPGRLPVRRGGGSRRAFQPACAGPNRPRCGAWPRRQRRRSARGRRRLDRRPVAGTPRGRGRWGPSGSAIAEGSRCASRAIFDVSGAETCMERWWGSHSTVVEISFGHETRCRRPVTVVIFDLTADSCPQRHSS